MLTWLPGSRLAYHNQAYKATAQGSFSGPACCARCCCGVCCGVVALQQSPSLSAWWWCGSSSGVAATTPHPSSL
jgi:hypothetical protein